MTRLVSQRYPELMSSERAELDALLSSSVLVHIGLEALGRPVVFPTGFAVIDGALVIHGSTGSRWMRAIVGQDVSATVTRLEGVLVARSNYESAMLYRSAMLFGRFAPVDEGRKRRVLDAFSDRILPGRSAETRPATKKELAATMALEMPIEKWSLRILDAWPEDPEEDVAGDAWAGLVRFGPPSARVDAAPDLRDGIPVRPSVEAVARHPERLV